MKGTQAQASVVAEGQPLKLPEKAPLFGTTQILLRISAAVASLLAASLMVTDKQSSEVLGMSFDAKYSYSPAFM